MTNPNNSPKETPLPNEEAFEQLIKSYGGLKPLSDGEVDKILVAHQSAVTAAEEKAYKRGWNDRESDRRAFERRFLRGLPEYFREVDDL